MDCSIEFLAYRKKCGEKAFIDSYDKRTKWINSITSFDELFEMPIIDLGEGPDVPSEMKEIAVWGVFVVTYYGFRTVVESPSMKYFTEDYPLDKGEEWSEELRKAFYKKVSELLCDAVCSSLIEYVVEASA